MTPTFAIQAGEAVTLPAGERAWRVASGKVEVYLAGDDGRWLVAIAGAGRHLFPLAGDEEVALVAIGVDDAVIGLDEVDDPAALAESAAAWVRRAGRRPGMPPVPADAIFVAPGDVADGGAIAGEEVVAVALGDGGALCGFATARAEGLSFVGGSIWVGTTGPTEIASLAQVVASGELVAAMRRFTLALHPLHRAVDCARDSLDLVRLARRDADAAEIGVDGGHALAAVARALGVTPKPIRDTPGEDGFGAVPQRARRIGFRARRVTLARDWWTQDLGPLVVRRSEGQAVDALVWGKGGYRTSAGWLVDASGAAAFDSDAYTGYAPLPAGVDGFIALGRYAIRGAGGDFRSVAIAGLAAAVIGFPLPFVIAWLFDDVIPAGNAGLLVGVGIALFAATLMQMLLQVAQGLAIERIEARSAIRLTAAMTDRVLRLPARFFRTLAAADFSQRLDSVDAMRQLVIGSLLSSGINAAFSLFYLGLLFAGDPLLAMLAVVTTLIEIGITFVSRLVQLGPLRTTAELQGKIAGITYETLDGIAKLRTAAAEPRAMARWHEVYEREQVVRTRAGIVGQRFGNVSALYSTLVMAALFAAAALLSSQHFSPGSFLAFLTAFGIFQGSFAGLCNTFMSVMSAQPLADRARVVLTAEPEVGEGQEDPGTLSGAIAVEGLVFGYAADQAPVLDGVTFAVRPGEHVAIVGGSGSGKSTILRLLLGFEKPRAGSILFDGQDLAGLDPGRVRAQIGVVLQSSKLFAGSILENIRGPHDIGLDRCLAAVERAGLADDLARFPMGIHTPITEGAGTLSGGQRQRILIARAIAGDPRILFLDEATSALDSLTQAVVARTIDEMHVARITIAHRLSTVRNADRICVLAGGRVAEQGSFDDLIARGGLFADLARRQLMDDGT